MDAISRGFYSKCHKRAWAHFGEGPPPPWEPWRWRSQRSTSARSQLCGGKKKRRDVRLGDFHLKHQNKAALARYHEGRWGKGEILESEKGSHVMTAKATSRVKMEIVEELRTKYRTRFLGVVVGGGFLILWGLQICFRGVHGGTPWTECKSF